VKDVFCSLFDLEEDKCTIITHGIYKTNISRQIESERSFNVAYLGAFTYEKGAESFLKIVEEMNNEKYMERITFHVIGELGYPLPKEFRSYPHMKLSGAYKFHDVNVILKRLKIDLVVLPSIWPETYSYTLSEAVVNGIPVLASDLGALRERISALSAGYLVPNESPVRRSVALIRDFYRYPELREYFHTRCIDASKRIPDIAEMGCRYETLYKNGLAEGINCDG
jgi:glycosyltransferase involved in cell wall biosynthesis